MESIRDRVCGFLAKFTAPDENIIQNFVKEIVSENPALETEDFKKNLLMVLEQRDKIKEFEKELSSFGKDSPVFIECESILREAKGGHENLEDISNEIETLNKILISSKGDKPSEFINVEPKAPEPDVKPSSQAEKAPEIQVMVEKPEKKVLIETGLSLKEISIEETLQQIINEGAVTETSPVTEKILEGPVAAEEDILEGIIDLGDAEAETEIEEEITDITSDKQVVKKGKKRKKKKEEIEVSLEESPVINESADDLMRHLADHDTRDLLRDQLTPEKLAVFEILEEKLM